MIQNMKEKLMQTAVEHELELSRVKEEMSLFENKAHQATQLEDAMDHYKEKFEEVNQQVKRLEAG